MVTDIDGYMYVRNAAVHRRSRVLFFIVLLDFGFVNSFVDVSIHVYYQRPTQSRYSSRSYESTRAMAYMRVVNPDGVLPGLFAYPRLPSAKNGDAT